jgi:hypothetical protein
MADALAPFNGARPSSSATNAEPGIQLEAAWGPSLTGAAGSTSLRVVRAAGS